MTRETNSQKIRTVNPEMKFDSAGRLQFVSARRLEIKPERIRSLFRPPIDQAHNFGCGAGCGGGNTGCLGE